MRMHEMKENFRFPPGWDEARIRRLLEHYESQTEEQAAAEDEELSHAGREHETPAPLAGAVSPPEGSRACR